MGPKLPLLLEPTGGLEHSNFMEVLFDSWLTWADYIRKIEEKCKKVINVMRCLTGREWGASWSALKRLDVALIRCWRCW